MKAIVFNSIDTVMFLLRIKVDLDIIGNVKF